MTTKQRFELRWHISFFFFSLFVVKNMQHCRKWLCVYHQIEIENYETFCLDSSVHWSQQSGFHNSSLTCWWKEDQLHKSCLLVTEVEFNGLNRTGFVDTYLCLIMEAELAQKSVFLTKAKWWIVQHTYMCHLKNTPL